MSSDFDRLPLDILEVIVSFSDHVTTLIALRQMNRSLVAAVTASVRRDFNGNSDVTVRPPVQFDQARTSGTLFRRQLCGPSSTIQRLIVAALQRTLTHFEYVAPRLDEGDRRTLSATLAEALVRTPVDFPNLRHLSVREILKRGTGSNTGNAPITGNAGEAGGGDNTNAAAQLPALRRLEGFTVVGNRLTIELIHLLSAWQTQVHCLQPLPELQQLVVSCAAENALRLIHMAMRNPRLDPSCRSNSWSFGANLLDLQLTVTEPDGQYCTFEQRRVELPAIARAFPQLRRFSFIRGVLGDFVEGLRCFTAPGSCLEKLVLESCDVVASASPAPTASEEKPMMFHQPSAAGTDINQSRQSALTAVELRIVNFIGHDTAECLLDALQLSQNTLAGLVIQSCRVGPHSTRMHASPGWLAEFAEPLAAIVRGCTQLSLMRFSDVNVETGMAQALLHYSSSSPSSQQQQPQHRHRLIANNVVVPASPWAQLVRLELAVHDGLVLPHASVMPNLARLRLGVEGIETIPTVSISGATAGSASGDAFYPRLTDLHVSWIRLTDAFVNGVILNNPMLRRLQLDHTDVLSGPATSAWLSKDTSLANSGTTGVAALSAARYLEELVVRNGTASSSPHNNNVDGRVDSIATWKAGLACPTVTALAARLVAAQAHAKSATRLVILDTSTRAFNHLCASLAALPPPPSRKENTSDQAEPPFDGGVVLPSLEHATLQLHDVAAIGPPGRPRPQPGADDDPTTTATITADAGLQNFLAMAPNLKKLQVCGPMFFEFHGSDLDRLGPVLREAATFSALATVPEVELSLVRLRAPSSIPSSATAKETEEDTTTTTTTATTARTSRLFVRHTLSAVREGWPDLVAACRPRLRRVDVVSQSNDVEEVEPEVLLDGLLKDAPPSSTQSVNGGDGGVTSSTAVHPGLPDVETTASPRSRKNAAKAKKLLQSQQPQQRPVLFPALQVVRFQLTSTTRSLRFAYEDPKVDASLRSQRLNDALRAMAPAAVFQLDQNIPSVA